MVSDFDRKHHELLATLIDHVLRCRTGIIRVPNLADYVGFSRYHLARLFREVTQETLEGFVRRIRLERAAFLLLHSEASIEQVGADCGYKNSEAFSRAFKAAYGNPPTKFRQGTDSWKLHSPTGLHWNEHWGSEHPEALPGRVDIQMVFRPRMDAAVWDWMGTYSRIADGWEELLHLVDEQVPSDRTFITLYHDNMWTHPTITSMRADLGWMLEPGDPIPAGMRKLSIPEGKYEVTTRFLLRTERNDAWSYVGARSRLRWSFDEYPAWPLPFDKVLTRIVRGPCPEEKLS